MPSIAEIAQKIGANTDYCRDIANQLEQEGLIKSLGYKKGTRRSHILWPDELEELIKERMVKKFKPTKSKPANRLVINTEPKDKPAPLQRRQLDLFISGVIFGNRHNAEPGYAGRLVEAIHKGKIKEV